MVLFLGNNRDYLVLVCVFLQRKYFLRVNNRLLFVLISLLVFLSAVIPLTATNVETLNEFQCRYKRGGKTFELKKMYWYIEVTSNFC